MSSVSNHAAPNRHPSREAASAPRNLRSCPILQRPYGLLHLHRYVCFIAEYRSWYSVATGSEVSGGLVGNLQQIRSHSRYLNHVASNLALLPFAPVPSGDCIVARYARLSSQLARAADRMNPLPRSTGNLVQLPELQSAFVFQRRQSLRMRHPRRLHRQANMILDTFVALELCQQGP